MPVGALTRTRSPARNRYTTALSFKLTYFMKYTYVYTRKPFTKYRYLVRRFASCYLFKLTLLFLLV